jgi:tryptophanyl-tRNA synthetase
VKLQELHDDYKSGKVLSSEMKKILIEVLIERVGRHKRARALVTEEIVDSFMAVRKMNVLEKK